MKVEKKSVARHTSARVVIVGGGIAGLSAAVRVAQAGFPVTVLEASSLGDGATMRNQGWLHSGAWFAPQQQDLAQLCHQSLQQTLRFCPESVEESPASMVYLLSRGDSDPERWTTAWESAAIPYQELSAEDLFQRFPGLAISQAQHAFQLPDRSMQADLLLRRLAEAAENAGAEIRSHSPVARLIDDGESVQGVELTSGERIPARLVVLAAGAKGGWLYPGFGTRAVGANAQTVLIALKTHLIGVRPAVSRWPLCVVDADGLNHLPHQSMSVFGTSRWLPVHHTEDQATVDEEVQRAWNHVQRIFPALQRSENAVMQWAGTTVQAMHVDDLEAAQIPQPVVIDHQQESHPVENLISVFPGRASLWPHLADQTCSLVRAKLGTPARDIAQPPWGAQDAVEVLSRGCC